MDPQLPSQDDRISPVEVLTRPVGPRTMRVDPAAGDEVPLRGREMKRIAVLLIILIPAGCSEARKPHGAESREKLTREALHTIHRDQRRHKQPSASLIADMIFTLDELLRDPKDDEAGTRRLACDILGWSKSRKAIPVLLKALEDPYVKVEFTGMGSQGAAHMEWYAVWRDADEALREITGANPIPQPRQRSPIDGQRESVRKAWAEWWEHDAREDDPP